MARGNELGGERDGENAERKRDNCGASGKLRAWEKERKIAGRGRGKSPKKGRKEKERDRDERRDVAETVGIG